MQGQEPEQGRVVDLGAEEPAPAVANVTIMASQAAEDRALDQAAGRVATASKAGEQKSQATVRR